MRGVLADALAVSGKAIGAFARAELVGEADVHEADRFFGSSAGGSGDAGDTDADGCASAFADAVGKRECHFGADRAFGFDHCLRNADQGSFQFVAVADYAAKKIGRAAGNISEAFGEHPSCAAFGDGDSGVIFGEDARDDFFESFAVRGIEVFAESESHALRDFVEQLFGFGGIARPGARMELRAGWRGEDGGFRIGIELVERADSGFDIGFAEAGNAQVAGEQSLVVAHFREARRDFGFEHGFQFVGDAGKQDKDVAVRFEPKTGCGAAGILKNRGAFGDHGLADVDFGHGTREAAEAFLDAAQDFFVAAKFSAEEIGDSFARAVVVGGTEAAGRDDEVGAIESVTKGGVQFGRRIADDGFVEHANAEAVEFTGEPKGIRVQAKGSEKFGTDSYDLRIHLEMLYSMTSGMRKSGSACGRSERTASSASDACLRRRVNSVNSSRLSGCRGRGRLWRGCGGCFRTEDEDRTFGVAHQFVSDRAESDPAPSGYAVGGDDDEVGFFGFGDTHDFHGGIVAQADGAAGLQALLLQLGYDVGHARGSAGDQFVFVFALGEDVGVANEFGDHGDDVDEHEFGAVAGGNVFGYLEGLHGKIAKVDGGEDSFG